MAASLLPVGFEKRGQLRVKRIATWITTIPVGACTFKTCDMKNDDSYENGAFKASTMRTVTRLASLTRTSPVTVGTFEMVNIKNNDSYKDASWTPATPVTVHTFARPGLGVRGPHHWGGGGGGQNAECTTMYVYTSCITLYRSLNTFKSTKQGLYA